ncbi:LysR substrate-binding domain-containing protein [Streptomyces sp. NBC_00882]|uniref:LysR substrate-binding domain-containing protein n=1 Tax=Streptomyces sp. NBC_00882 TaxID=2975856 RepID=UPI00386AB012|nr:LysR substrate-binding domain-containing protein [Streptomyces sp. NBC_00882]
MGAQEGADRAAQFRRARRRGKRPVHAVEGAAEWPPPTSPTSHWWRLKVGYGLRHVVDRLFREAGLTPRIKNEVTELSTLRALLYAGMGVALVPAPWRGGTPVRPERPRR